MEISTRRKVCSSCFTVQSQLQYIDFEALWEGPLVAQQTVEGVAIEPLNIDDLILCEDCLRSAARLIGMSDSEDASVRADLEAEVTELRLARVESERRLTAIQKALEGRPSSAPKKAPAKREKASA